jgi:hypothetical protein
MQQLVNERDFNVDPTNRLRIATRIHFALLRHYDEDVAISRLLAGGAEAREALWVCEASAHEELITLAGQLAVANKQERRAARVPGADVRTAPAPIAAQGSTPQDMAWAHDTSGFGVSRLPSFMDPPTTISHWLKPSTWLRRGTTPNLS